MSKLPPILADLFKELPPPGEENFDLDHLFNTKRSSSREKTSNANKDYNYDDDAFKSARFESPDREDPFRPSDRDPSPVRYQHWDRVSSDLSDLEEQIADSLVAADAPWERLEGIDNSGDYEQPKSHNESRRGGRRTKIYNKPRGRKRPKNQQSSNFRESQRPRNEPRSQHIVDLRSKLSRSSGYEHRSRSPFADRRRSRSPQASNVGVINPYANPNVSAVNSYANLPSTDDAWKNSTEQFLLSIGAKQQPPTGTSGHDVFSAVPNSSKVDLDPFAPIPTELPVQKIANPKTPLVPSFISTAVQRDAPNWEDYEKPKIQNRTRSRSRLLSRSRSSSSSSSSSRSVRRRRSRSRSRDPPTLGEMSKCKEDLFWNALLTSDPFSSRKSPEPDPRSRRRESLTNELQRNDKQAPEAADWTTLMDTFQASLDADNARNNRLDHTENWREPENRRFDRDKSFEYMYSKERYDEPEKSKEPEQEESVWMILARQASLDQKSLSSKPVEKKPVVAAPVQNPEVLRPGNYLLVTWDALLWVEEETQETHLCQISASIPEGDDFRCFLLPQVKIGTRGYPYQRVRNNYFLIHPFANNGLHTSPWRVKVVTPVRNPSRWKTGMEKFLSFLENACQRVRPAYDGVLLLSYDQDFILHLCRILGKDALLKKRFENVVKGMGDLTEYLAECHAMKFWKKTTISEPNLSAENTCKTVLQHNFNYDIHSFKSTQTYYEMLTKLLGSSPTYSNFFGKFIHPLHSKLVRKLSSVRMTNERLAMFEPLKKFVAKGLADQRDELVELGLYAKNDPDNFLANPEDIAEKMIRGLLTSSFDLDSMLETYKELGIDALELDLRNSFMGKMMMNQARTVVEQTIRTTKLVVAFFKEHGHKTHQTLMDESKIVLDPPVNVPFDIWYPFNRMIAEFFVEFSQSGLDQDQLNGEVTSLVGCFIGVGFTYDKLIETYATKQNFKNNVGWWLEEFCSSNLLSIGQLQKFVMDYLKKTNWTLPNLSTIKEESDPEENNWAPYKPLYDLFVSSFEKWYSKHEVLRGGKFIISALLHAGLIHDTLEIICKEEMKEKSTFVANMRTKMVKIFQQNFPKLKTLTLKQDDMVNFLMHYCVVTFDRSEKEQTEKKTGQSVSPDQEIPAADKNLAEAQTSNENKTKRTKEELTKNAITKKRKNEVQRRRKSECDYDSENVQELADTDNSDDAEIEEPPHVLPNAQKKSPTDALSLCRQKLATCLPKEDSSDFKEYKEAFKTLRTLTLFIEMKLKPMVVMCGGSDQQAENIAKYVRELLAYSGLNFATLKDYYRQGGAYLVDELNEAFADKSDLVPPGITARSLGNMIYDFYLQQSFSS